MCAYMNSRDTLTQVGMRKRGHSEDYLHFENFGSKKHSLGRSSIGLLGDF